ncbi:L-threonylcarbamoyladenylate synthase [Microbaculum marinum]|uniref:Threonylcarbamoyl-AMP synthase n=1 Tax=Microbaculum marinum TaxID=1764581 RepID=A0AAW9RRZ1_9HYPH
MDIWTLEDTTSRQEHERRVADATRHLAAGRLVVLPTETVYGLAADATTGMAVARIFEAKGRPRFNPLISHVAGCDMAEAHGLFDETARRLADRFWPGPLTLVVPRAAGSTICDLATAGLDTVGLRWPDSQVTGAIIAALGRPVAAPSANRSGRISPTTAEAAIEELGASVAMVVDAGPCRVGLESTIVACIGDRPVLLRPGGVARGEIEAVLGTRLDTPHSDPDRPRAPGMLASHYAPDAAVRLNATHVDPDEALLAFGPDLPHGATQARAMLNLSERGDLAEAAVNLFASLRRLDASGARRIAVAPIPGTGLGEAILDRLRRAAAPRG